MRAEPATSAWLEVVAILCAFALPLSLYFPLTLTSWGREELLMLYQTLLLFWTLVGAVLAAIFGRTAAVYAGRSWVTAVDALHVSNYLTLSDQWNKTYERINKDPETLALLRLRLPKYLPEEGAAGVRAITEQELEKAMPLVQELFTTFDAWLVQNQLKAFPVVAGVSTWKGWYETIVNYFMRFPLLIDAEKERGTGEYTPWLRQAREDAEWRLTKRNTESTM